MPIMNIETPKTYVEYLNKMIEITDRYITDDAHLLSGEALIFHKASHKAYRHALKLYKRYQCE